MRKMVTISDNMYKVHHIIFILMLAWILVAGGNLVVLAKGIILVLTLVALFLMSWDLKEMDEYNDDPRLKVERVKEQLLAFLKEYDIEPHDETWLEEGNVCMLWTSTSKQSCVITLIPNHNEHGDSVVVATAQHFMTMPGSGNVPSILMEGIVEEFVDLPDDHWEQGIENV